MQLKEKMGREGGIRGGGGVGVREVVRSYESGHSFTTLNLPIIVWCVWKKLLEKIEKLTTPSYHHNTTTTAVTTTK
jgi:hypothetical protein